MRNGVLFGGLSLFVGLGASGATAQVLVTEDDLLLAPTPATYDELGYSVALDGDRLAATCFGRHSVQVFARAGGSWSLEQEIVGPGSWFGTSIALDGDLLAASGPSWYAELVYLYRRSGSTWSLETTFPKLEGGNGPWGTRVDVDGERLAVGIGEYDHNGENAGAAYVHRKEGTTWTLEQELLPPVIQPSAKFGSSIALDGDTLLVAAGGTNVVYVFRRTGYVWSLEASLNAPIPGRGFGVRVALAGDVAAVTDYCDLADTQAGAVHVYRRAGTSWTYEATLLPPDARPYDHWGCQLALGDDLVVAGPRYGPTENVFEYSGGAWTPTGILAPAEVWGTLSEQAVAVSADAIAVGNRYSSFGGPYAAGATRVYDRPLAPLAQVECTGDGSAGVCPCGNASDAGALAGCASSLARGALLGAAGSTDLAADDLRLFAWYVPNDQPGLLFAAPLSIPGIPFGDGLRCLGGGAVRLGARPGSSLLWGPGLGALGGFQPGESWTFQVVYRDPLGPCGSGLDWTAAARTTFH